MHGDLQRERLERMIRETRAMIRRSELALAAARATYLRAVPSHLRPADGSHDAHPALDPANP